MLGLVLEAGPATNALLPLLVEPVPEPPIELVLPGVVPLLLVISLLPVPLPVVLDGLVVLLEEVEPGVASCLLQALNERAAATVRVATAIWVREVFIRKLLEVVGIGKGTSSPYRAL